MRRQTRPTTNVAASDVSNQRGRSVFGIKFLRKPADGQAASGAWSGSALRSIGSAAGRTSFIQWLRRSRVKKLRRQVKVLERRMGLTESHLAGVTRQVTELAPQIGELDQRFSALGPQLADMDERFSALGPQLADLDQRFSALGPQIGELDQRFSDRLAATSENIQTVNQNICSETEELRRELRETRDALERAVQDVIPALKREIMFLQRRVAGISQARPRTSDSASAEAQEIANYGPLDSLYVAFEDVFRGSRDDIKQRVMPYIERLKLAGAGQPGNPILDIGCGRGEWLEALKEKDLIAYGIDINGMMVETSRGYGLDVRRADLMEHLHGLDDASRSAITAFHVVEHLPFEVLVEFLDEALRVMAPGGVLLLETPNPENIRVGASTFYNDPTHRNPLMPEPLRFMVEHRGFVEAEIIRLQPFPSHERLQGDGEDQEKLNRLLFGPQDYSVLARRL
jgi:O-antigen chain-terminating methyltransferase